MRYANLTLCFTLLFLCLTPAAGSRAAASGGGRPVSEKTSDARPAPQREGARQAGGKKENKPKQPAPAFSKDLDALRARFNRDKGHVRLLMLLSPT